MKIEKYRDLTLLHVMENYTLAIACDSCGGIGLKDQDVLKTDNKIVGYFTASVVLCELMAFRAVPQIMVNNFCVEMKPTGEKILAGIKEAIEEVGLDADTVLTGSTEENIPVVQTGIGLTCIGAIHGNINFKTEPGDELFVIGRPKVGAEVLKTDGISNLKVIKEINNKPGIQEILPVGSKGIDYEVSELCRCSNINFKYKEQLNIDIKKSAGPVTCILVSGKKEAIKTELENIGVSYSYLGIFLK